jgi:hypothetical protein
LSIFNEKEIHLLNKSNTFVYGASTLTGVVIFLASASLTIASPGLPELSPACPFPVTATAVSPTHIHVAWSVTAFQRRADVAFRVERSPDGQTGWAEAGTVSGLSFEDTGLMPNTHYYYRVFGVGAQGISRGCADADERTLPAAPAAGTTRLTQAQAVAAAAAFCRTVGAPVTVPGRAEYPAPNEFPNEAEHHWQKRWRVVFPKQATVEIVDATGTIAQYKNTAFDEYSIGQRDRVLGTAISEEEAVRCAESAMRDTGQVRELSTPTAIYGEPVKPAVFGTRLWTVRWTRQFRGIPYRDDTATILLDADTGTVERVFLSFPSSPAIDATVVTSDNQAVSIAHGILASAGLSDAVLKTVQRRILSGNTFWQPGGSEAIRVPGPARSVWVCSFGTHDIGENHSYEVWVDTETGVVIGGNTFAYSVNSHPAINTEAPLSLRPMVPLSR